MIELKDGLCKEWVLGRDYHGHQCRREAVKDGYCAIHHPDYITAKREERQSRWEIKWHNERVQGEIEDYTVAAKLAKKHNFDDAETIFLQAAENLKRELR